MPSTDTQNSGSASLPTQATTLQGGAPTRAATPLPQARDFLTKVLPCPDNGYLNIHTKQPGRDGMPGRGFTDLDAAIGFIDWQKREKRDIYVCMSLQRDAEPRKDKNGREYLYACRHSKTAVALKTLFLELDCKFYDDDHRKTLAAFQEWRGKVGMPDPTVVVNSGNGLHCYWTLDRAIPRDTWSILAHALEESCKRHGLKIDTGVNSDASRVLRVPETLNFKSDPPKEVKLFWMNQAVDYKVEDMETILGPYVTDVPEKVSLTDLFEDPPLDAPGVPVPSELAAGIQTDDSPMPQDEIRQCVDIIPNPSSNGWAEWNHIGMILWAASRGEDYGLDEWERWSKKHPAYGIDEKDSCADRWKAYEGSPPDNLSGGSLIYMARKAKGDDKWRPVRAGAIVPQPPDAFDGLDPLDFVMTTTEDAVDRINHEYFFRRDTSEICRQDAVTGDIQVLTSQQLKTALAGRWVEAVDPKTGKTKVRDAATVWLESRRRREVHGLQYRPNHVGLRPQHLNLWLGWGLEPAPTGDCSIVVDHITNVVAGGDQQKAAYILDWCADILQNPTRKPGVALVLRGPEGTGKSVLGEILCRLLGRRNVVVNADRDRLLGKFNSALAGKILIQAEESFFAGDPRTTDALKHLITGPTLEIEIKFGRSFEVDSFHRLLMTSNHAQVIQASSEARRFVVCDVSDARRGDADYFDRLYAVADGRDDATAQAFMQHLLDRDLSGFRPWAAQQQFLGDDALVQQKALSLTPPLAWLWEVLHEVTGEARDDVQLWHDGKPDRGLWPSKFSRGDAVRAFRDWAAVAKPHGASAYTGSEQRFWKEIRRVIPKQLTKVKDSDGDRWVAISLDDARACFQRYMRGEVNV